MVALQEVGGRGATGVRVLDSLEDIPAEVSRMCGYKVDVAYDIETVGLDPINDRMVAAQFKPKGKRALIIDVRHYSKDELHELGLILAPLFDGSVTLIGHNLLFDLGFTLAQMKIGAHKVYDTQLAEQTIYGLGWASAEKRKIGLSLAALGERYGIPVHKEERSWFYHLDERPDEWNAPFPPEQITYMRQDVSVPHKIKEHQGEAIYNLSLYDVIDLEMRALLPVVGVEVAGVQIDREGWLRVIDRVEARAKELEQTVLLGKEPTQNEAGKCVEPGFEGLAVHVLRVRQDRYMAKWHPYEEQMIARELFVATRKSEWEHGMLALPMAEDRAFKNWSEYKRASLEWWHEHHERMLKPPENKAGVNLGSPKQVLDGFNDLGIPVTSVSEEALTPYLGKHPLVRVYIDYVGARKIVTVYGREKGKKKQAFLDMLDGNDRLHASYQPIGADTDRMSSYLPNLQQIPDNGVGKELRQKIVAGPGYVFVDADFSNIELRIVAELSGDKFLLDAFASGRDVHAYTAKVMFGLTDDQATKDWTDSHDAVVGDRTLVGTSYRKIGKTINYQCLYGGGVRRLALKLEIKESESKVLLDLYYKTFATAIAWLNTQKYRLDAARKRGEARVFAETRSGWKRWFDIPPAPKHPANGKQVSVEAMDAYNLAVDEWRSTNAGIKRQLANTPIQGLSAAVTKEAVALWYEWVGYDEKMRLVGIIHDELLVECLPELVLTASNILETVMMQAMKKYLKVVDLGEVHAVQTPYWSH